MKIFLIGAVHLFDFAPCKNPAFWQAKHRPPINRSVKGETSRSWKMISKLENGSE
jgi:hypothetical protein